MNQSFSKGMKKIYSTILLAAVALAMNAQSTPLPYKSNMYITYSTLDDGWTTYNGTRRGHNFEYDSDNTGAALATPGTTSAARYSYHEDYAANCWLFSPTFDLKAGGNYVVGVWVKTKGSDTESFKVCYGAEASVAGMTNVVFDKKDYSHSDDYEFISATVTPETDMTVHFGIHCYSPAYHYVLSLTGFSVSDENGSTDVPVVPPTPVEAVDLPYTYDFTDKADFAKNWTSASGADAYSTAAWNLNDWQGWADFDDAYNEKEDNWLISNPLKFSEAGNYAIVYKGLVNGKLEFLLGTDPADLTTFKSVKVLEYVDETSNNDAEYVLPFELTEGGEYRLAIRACADKGSFMGYRVKTIKVRSDNPVPAAVTDLAAASEGEELSVKLTWTNPTVDHHGNPLAELTKLELYRNDALLKDDFTTLGIGEANTWTDELAEAGTYTYHIIAYNANGCADAEPVKVSPGYVGRPTAELPYSADATKPEDMALFTACDANKDGKTFHFEESEYAWSNTMKVKLEEGEVFDDYIMSPYLHLTPGYYAFSFDTKCRTNSVEAGYAKDRRNPAESFVKVAEIINYQEYGAYSKTVIINVEEEGDYVFGLHAIGTCTSSTYPEVTLNKLSVKATKSLPTAVTDLKAIDAPGEQGFDVTLTWVNPTLDNAGLELATDEALTLTVYRDGSVVATLDGEGYTPGNTCSWVDKGVAAGEDHKYSVNVANANGMSEDTKPEVEIHVGPIVAIPYETSDFTEWNLEDSGSYPWKIDPDTKYAVWDGMESWFPSYTIYSPYIRLEENKEYDLEATFDYPGGETQDIKLVSLPNVTSYNYTIHSTFQLPEGAADHVVKYIITSDPVATVAETTDDTPTEPVEEAEKVNVPNAKFLIGFRVSEAGKIILKNFSLKLHNTVGVTGVLTGREEALVFNGVVSYPSATDITVVDLTGRVLRAVHADSLDLNDLNGAGIVIVTAPGYRAIKLAL